MRSARHFASYRLFGVAAMLLAACSSQMQPARQALDGVSNAVEAIPADATQYLPEQVASVKQGLDGLNASFDQKDYAGVLARSPAILAEAKNVAAAAAAKKDAAMRALADEWKQLSDSVPMSIASVKTRVDALSKSHRVAKDIDLVSAKSALSDASAMWQKAQNAFDAKHIADAVTAATSAKSRAEAAASALKMS
jgi:hypothetical protein